MNATPVSRLSRNIATGLFSIVIATAVSVTPPQKHMLIPAMIPSQAS